jgi:cytochrome bd-type quinol oxidase subunit 2
MRTAVLCLGVILLCNVAAWAQDGPKGPPRPNEPGYGQGPYVLDDDIIGSPWHDTVHWVGSVGTLLAFGVALAGAAIYFGFGLRGKPYNHPARKAIRSAHIAVGITAIALGTAHYIGRSFQAGEAWFGWIPPTFAELCFLVVLASGILRTWTPKRLRKGWRLFAYVHRLAVLGALYYAIRHSLYQISKFESQ